jgi:hypothetical protein
MKRPRGGAAGGPSVESKVSGKERELAGAEQRRWGEGGMIDIAGGVGLSVTSYGQRGRD